MPLVAGNRLGPYEIQEALGAGGMGEVYRARDTRLERSVAVKVLASHLAVTPEVRERFQREARALSSLNHPHICAIYDVGQQEGLDFLVIELLQGETLAQRLEKGPLPLDQSLKIALQIADALDKAHRQGIVHRDLKPANIMLTKSGAKLMDFGLAKPAQAAMGAAAMTAMITRSEPLTAQGTLVGTFQYMAPEQLEGKDADARSDIFSFGAVLYEVLTGRRAFTGKTQASIIASVLASDPPPASTLQPMTPPALDRLVRICLEKDPEERLQTAHDLKLQLELIAEGGSQIGIPRPTVAHRHRVARLAWGLAVLAAVAAVALGALYLKLRFEPQPVVRSQVLPPENTGFTSTGPVVISPDGTRLAFVARTHDGRPSLWVRSLNSVTPQPLSGTENASFPFWSADSRYVGFFAEGKLKKIDANGGPPQALAEAPNGRGGAWSRDNVILFVPGATNTLQRVPASGGTVVPASEFDASHFETGHRWPWFLPDGKHFLFFVRSAQKREFTGVALGKLDSLQHTVLIPTDSNGIYASGRLLFVRDQTLMAQPFNPRRLESAGDAAPIAERITVNGAFYRAVFSASENGNLVFQSGGAFQGWELAWFDRTGKKLGVAADSSRFFWPRISPDGKRIAAMVNDTGGNDDIWVFDLARGTRTRLTFEPSTEGSPVWTPDGQKVIFNSNRKGLRHIYQKAANGVGAEEVVLETDGVDESPQSISSDGRYLVYQRLDARSKNQSDIWVLPLFGERKPFPILDTAFHEVAPVISPNGKWMAYCTNESGRMEVYITSFPERRAKWQVSNGGGIIPRWRQDGKELFFLSDDNQQVMAVDIRAVGNSLELGTPRGLFRTTPVAGPGGPYTAAADGQKFLVNFVPFRESDTPLTLVTNWPAELKK